MLPAMRELSDSERAFALAILAGKNIQDAAASVGCTNPSQDGNRLMRHPRVVAALREETTRLLIVEDAPLARLTLRRAMKEDGVAWNARVAAAKTILDRAGYVTPAKADKPGEKPLADQDTQDLRATIERLESELAGRAKDVTPSQPVD